MISGPVDVMRLSLRLKKPTAPRIDHTRPSEAASQHPISHKRDAPVSRTLVRVESSNWMKKVEALRPCDGLTVTLHRKPG